jgi:hypothetical protein
MISYGDELMNYLPTLAAQVSAVVAFAALVAVLFVFMLRAAQRALGGW